MKITSTFIIILISIYFDDYASGAVVEFADGQRDAWFSSVGGTSNVSTVDFTGYPDLTLIDEQWAHLGIHFSGLVVTSGFDDFINPNDGWGCFGEPDINVTFDKPIEWIAADFPGTAVFDLFLNGQLIHTTQRFGNPGAGHFGGLISDQGFDAVRIYRLSTGLTFLDDLHFGPPIAVPVPGAFAPIALALITLPRRKRRRPIRDSSQ